jgi:hypothetical protein
MPNHREAATLPDNNQPETAVRYLQYAGGLGSLAAALETRLPEPNPPRKSDLGIEPLNHETHLRRGHAFFQKKGAARSSTYLILRHDPSWQIFDQIAGLHIKTLSA